jgi:hypothetical protein
MNDEPQTSFGLVIKNIREDIASAKEYSCGKEGHALICKVDGHFADALEHIYVCAKTTPERTVAMLRSEVVTLVDSHAEDAVIRHLARRVPVDGRGAVVSATRDTSPQLSGFWGGAFQMLQKVGVPGAIVSACAVVGLALWVVLEVVRK